MPYASGAGKCPLASDRFLGEIARSGEAKQSCSYGRREFPLTQVGSPAKARCKFLFAWGYFGQVWLFGGMIKTTPNAGLIDIPR